MTFGQIIKKLRRDADMTQERLAEVLSVSAQAVSRWETDTGMPDVSLLPPLANLFGVTTDYLLGVDITKKDENIDAIREKANAYSDRGYFAEAREILEQGLKQYPNNYRMMRDLMYVSFYQYRAASDAKDTELAEKYKSEAIDLGEAILAGSTEDRTRHSAVQILCFLYKDSENAKRAVELAESMPSMAISRDFLLPDLADGDIRYEKTQRKVFDLVQFLEVAIGSMNVKLDSGEYAYTSEMRAALRDKQIAFLHLMFENGDFGFFDTHLHYIHKNQAMYYAKVGDNEKAIEHLRHAAEHALRFVKHMNKEPYTSLLFRNMPAGSFATTGTNNNAAELLNSMRQPVFDNIRDTEAFKSIRDELSAYAGKWDV